MLVRLAGFGYDAHAAEDTWQRILTFFGHHLRAQPDSTTT